jgi:hypothetical protein
MEASSWLLVAQGFGSPPTYPSTESSNRFPPKAVVHVPRRASGFLPRTQPFFAGLNIVNATDGYHGSTP